MSRCIVVMKLPITSCPQLHPPESSDWFPQRNVQVNTKFDAGSWLYSLSHFECDGHTVHMLTQQCLPSPLTSTAKSSFNCSHTRIPVQFPWLPGYIDVVQTILIILTTAGLFQDRPSYYFPKQKSLSMVIIYIWRKLRNNSIVQCFSLRALEIDALFQSIPIMLTFYTDDQKQN